jgi:alcohol dehydrogenase
VLFSGPDEPLEVRRFQPPTLQSGELFVRVRCCTLCGSDLHSYFGRRSTPCPCILGHEIVGDVIDLPVEGAVLDYAGNELRPGDRVSWSVMASCGACPRCLGGLPQKCLSLFKYGHQQLDESAPFAGGLADVCHLRRGTTICRVPERLSDDVAALATCAGATTAAALRLAGPVRDRAVLVQGAGTLGLLACAMAHDGGARSVLAVDAIGQRLKLAERFGATATALAGETDLSEIAGQTGEGIDIAMEMSGVPEALEAGIPTLALGGVYVLVGGAMPSRAAGVPMERVVKNLLTIRGIHNYWPEDLEAALRFLDRTHDVYPFGDLVGEHFELEQASEAFHSAATGRFCRVAVVPRRMD